MKLKKSQQALQTILQNISKEALADKLEVTTRTIENWLNGSVAPKFATRHYIIKLERYYKGRTK